MTSSPERKRPKKPTDIAVARTRENVLDRSSWATRLDRMVYEMGRRGCDGVVPRQRLIPFNTRWRVSKPEKLLGWPSSLHRVLTAVRYF